MSQTSKDSQPPESQEPRRESEATESNNALDVNCSKCFNRQQVNINAMDVTAVNIVLNNNRTMVLGDNTQVTICQRCFSRGRQRVPQHSESKTEQVFADGNDTSCQDGSARSSKKRRRKRKKPSEGQTASKSDVDGNSADGENSDSDHSNKFGDFLQCDSDD
ncbi:hypothetical protein OS493_036217 [Desmophyllum pertusum]|uniref:Uncharacterized protein n=1 Tax=Desmophyllum pertusum TaxID=174260 RepID=A0A9X0CDQ9_9CNID|nr:hypothetical protein OS493_036217 [Desmophyllum pertusum]